jgi:hypothetical protein
MNAWEEQLQQDAVLGILIVPYGAVLSTNSSSLALTDRYNRKACCLLISSTFSPYVSHSMYQPFDGKSPFLDEKLGCINNIYAYTRCHPVGALFI